MTGLITVSDVLEDPDWEDETACTHGLDQDDQLDEKYACFVNFGTVRTNKVHRYSRPGSNMTRFGDVGTRKRNPRDTKKKKGRNIYHDGQEGWISEVDGDELKFSYYTTDGKIASDWLNESDEGFSFSPDVVV